MRKVKVEEAIKNTMVADIESMLVLATFTVKADGKRDTQRFVAENYAIDFTGVTPDEIMVMAARTLVINAQRKYREAASSERMSVIGDRLDVRATIDAERKQADPKTKARNALAKLDPKVAAQLLAEYKID